MRARTSATLLYFQVANLRVMNIITQIQALQRRPRKSHPPEPWVMLEDELAEALALYLVHR